MTWFVTGTFAAKLWPSMTADRGLLTKSTRYSGDFNCTRSCTRITVNAQERTKSMFTTGTMGLSSMSPRITQSTTVVRNNRTEYKFALVHFYQWFILNAFDGHRSHTGHRTCSTAHRLYSFIRPPALCASAPNSLCGLKYPSTTLPCSHRLANPLARIRKLTIWTIHVLHISKDTMLCRSACISRIHYQTYEIILIFRPIIPLSSNIIAQITQAL